MKKPASLAFKPDLDEAARHWEAFYAGEIIDRPLVSITSPRRGMTIPPASTYYERVFGDLDEVIDRGLAAGEATFWGGDAVPNYWLTFGPDEIAVFAGDEFGWSGDSGDTNWSKHFVKDWASALPLCLHQDSPLYQRMLEFYRKAAERMHGKMLLASPDLHTNLDLLAGVRGSQQLCFDLVEQPETIDRAMLDAREIFKQLWPAVVKAGRMEESGYYQNFYSMEGCAILQCDFSAMISPAMFRRWALPAIEEEAQIVNHAIYHWDGPAALSHYDALVHSPYLHTLSFVPGDNHGTHWDYIDLLKRIQGEGKAVQVWGEPEAMKRLHRELQPEKTFYQVTANSQSEAEELLEWFVKNT
jgi:hypothetical protein